MPRKRKTIPKTTRAMRLYVIATADGRIGHEFREVEPADSTTDEATPICVTIDFGGGADAATLDRLLTVLNANVHGWFNWLLAARLYKLCDHSDTPKDTA